MTPEGAIPVETLSLPTPYEVGPVNAYVITSEPVTMIDAGVNTVDAENALKLGFATKGLFVESVERVLVTHGHPDHYGLVPVIRKASGATAYMSSYEIDRLTDESTMFEMGRLLLEAGFPRDLLKEMANKERQIQRVHIVAQLEAKPIDDGEFFEFEDFLLVAITLPGHTGGHLGFLEPASGTLFAGDTLLPHTSPNPIMEPEGDSPAQRRPSLRQYLDSLDRLESLDLNVVYPGHGPPITDPAATIKYMREHHQRRLGVVEGVLNGSGRTAFDIATTLYPSVNGYDYFLAVSEVLAHLDILIEQDRALNEKRNDGIEYFSRL